MATQRTDYAIKTVMSWVQRRLSNRVKKRVCSEQTQFKTRPNSALDLRRRCTSSVCEQSLCKVLI